MSSHTNKVYWLPLLVLTGVKFCLHMYANLFTDFGLHRDEYLYAAEGEHLQWGYMEVPPMIALLAKTANVMFGNTMWGLRVFPALIGAISILLVGMTIKELGGRRHAQVIGGFGFLMSLAFLGSNNLFQPVSFNQFVWFLIAYIIIRIVKYYNKYNDHDTRYWVALGVVVGLGILTKYSVIFFVLALIGALIISKYRRFALTRYPYIAIAIALVIASPNIWWQISFDFPVMRHMAELSETQLVNVSFIGFIVDQLLSHFAVLLIWLPGLIFVLFHPRYKDYRFIGITYLLLLGILIALKGKGYYAYGAYPMLFVFGGLAWEHWLKNRSFVIIPIVLLLNIALVPLVVPILSVDSTRDYSVFIKDNVGLESAFRWEDGKVRDMRQDYADMLGWDELPEKVARIYHSLTPDQQSKCILWGGHYGHAGALNFYRHKYDLPPAYSFNSSFVNWVPNEVDIEIQIQVEDSKMGPSGFYHSSILVDSISHPFARDPGYIYLNSEPTQDLRPIWKQLVLEEKKEAGF